MATQLPRYETMGVQYADLPRISTAPQQATVEGFSRLSQSLDRMLGFVQTELETKAQREAKKYAVENPLTKEQIDTALREGTGLKVPGAGEVFQQTYEQMQGAMLASQLQAEGEAKIGTALAKIKEGAEINLEQTQADLKDMIDGYATAVLALSPEKSVQLRAALTSSGNTLFRQAAEESTKRAKAVEIARLDGAVEQMRPLIEAVISDHGAIDPTTGKKIDTTQRLSVIGKTFLDFSAVDNGKAYAKFLSHVRDAKVGAVVTKVADPAYSKSGLDALTKLTAGDLGNLSDIYKGLTNEDKATIRNKVIDSFNDRAAMQKAEDDRVKAETVAASNAMEVEFLNPKTTRTRKQQITDTLVRNGTWSVTTAKTMMEPTAEGKGDVMIELRLKDQIAAGTIRSLADLSPYRSQLTNAQFESAGNYLRDQTYRAADQTLNRAAGIVGWELNPSEAKVKKRIELGERFQALVTQGVSPTDAASKAIASFDSDAGQKKLQAARDAATQEFVNAVKSTGATPPNLSLDKIDIGAIKGLNSKQREALKAIQDRYKETLR